MREVVATRTRIGATAMLIVAVAGAVPVIVLSLSFLPFGLYRQKSLNRSSASRDGLQRSGTKQGSFTDPETTAIMHHQV